MTLIGVVLALARSRNRVLGRWRKRAPQTGFLRPRIAIIIRVEVEARLAEIPHQLPDRIFQRPPFGCVGHDRPEASIHHRERLQHLCIRSLPAIPGLGKHRAGWSRKNPSYGNFPVGHESKTKKPGKQPPPTPTPPHHPTPPPPPLPPPPGRRAAPRPKPPARGRNSLFGVWGGAGLLFFDS